MSKKKSALRIFAAICIAFAAGAQTRCPNPTETLSFYRIDLELSGAGQNLNYDKRVRDAVLLAVSRDLCFHFDFNSSSEGRLGMVLATYGSLTEGAIKQMESALCRLASDLRYDKCDARVVPLKTSVRVGDLFLALGYQGVDVPYRTHTVRIDSMGVSKLDLLDDSCVTQTPTQSYSSKSFRALVERSAPPQGLYLIQARISVDEPARNILVKIPITSQPAK